MTDDVQSGVLGGGEGAEGGGDGAGEVGGLRRVLAEDAQRVAGRLEETGGSFLYLFLFLRLLFVVALLGARAQRDRDRHFAEDLRVRRQAASVLVQRRPIQRGLIAFEFVEHRGRATADAQTHDAEIAVTWTALPDAGAEAARLFACRDLQQGGPIRIVVGEEHALGVVRAQHLLPHLFHPRLVGLFLLGGGLAFGPQGVHAEPDR